MGPRRGWDRGMRLFLYGTLVDPRRLAGFAGRALPRLPARLPGWRRVALPGGRWPSLRRGPGEVEGVVVTVDAATLRRLTAYEGPAYRLVRLWVRTARGGLPAYAWIAPGTTRRPWP
ncbi:gamma-glutamylcyclotransferase family protein [Rhodovastum atsumiense]|nr:gamma-glutamylcyclotransferase family protein [Rhodovastum atsumiense]